MAQLLTNACLLLTGFLIFRLQRLFYGPLRPIETEQLYEKAWFAVTETCLAMTIFRGEFGGWFLVMFVALLAGKVWGWIGEGRVEFLEQQPPSNPRLFHARLASSLFLSVVFDALMLKFCVTTVLQQARPDMMVMFGFEFAILVVLSASTAARYAIALVEIYITRRQMKARIEERRAEIRAAREETIRRHAHSADHGHVESPVLPSEDDIDEVDLDVPGWEEKGRWVFYLDLATDFLKLNVYIAFFLILFIFYGLPIHILRDVVITVRSFGKRIVDFMRYRNATRHMNERYADATVNDLDQDDVCIICREQMTPYMRPGEDGGAPTRTGVPDRLRPKKLPCGHILHFACLRSWLERQQNCPTCRRPVLVRNRRARNGGGGGGQQAAAGGPRIYRFGPFRIGFGAARVDMLRNLQQQFNRAENVPEQHQQPGGIGQPRAGLNFDPGRSIPAAPMQDNPTSLQSTSSLGGTAQQIETQLQQMEGLITQEINSLRVTAEQVQLVRQLQSELQRLRSVRANNDAANDGGSYSSPPPSATLPSPFSGLTPDLRTSQLRAGDAQLPEGLVLPPGWSLFPLQSAEAAALNRRTVPSTAADHLGNHTPSVPSGTPTTASTGGGSRRTENVGSRGPMHQEADAPEAELEFQNGHSFEKLGGSSNPVENGGISEEENATLNHASSAGKGKKRAVTVEDAAEEEEEEEEEP